MAGATHFTTTRKQREDEVLEPGRTFKSLPFLVDPLPPAMSHFQKCQEHQQSNQLGTKHGPVAVLDSSWTTAFIATDCGLHDGRFTLVGIFSYITCSHRRAWQVLLTNGYVTELWWPGLSQPLFCSPFVVCLPHFYQSHRLAPAPLLALN